MQRAGALVDVMDALPGALRDRTRVQFGDVEIVGQSTRPFLNVVTARDAPPGTDLDHTFSDPLRSET